MRNNDGQVQQTREQTLGTVQSMTGKQNKKKKKKKNKSRCYLYVVPRSMPMTGPLMSSSAAQTPEANSSPVAAASSEVLKSICLVACFGLRQGFRWMDGWMDARFLGTRWKPPAHHQILLSVDTHSTLGSITYSHLATSTRSLDDIT